MSDAINCCYEFNGFFVAPCFVDNGYYYKDYYQID